MVAPFLTVFEISFFYLRYIVSDCNAVPIIYEPQKYAKTPEDAVAAVLSAGKPKANDSSFSPSF